ncbi:hypothetical protein AXG93_402s1100 [Marchantia polymorpha subsp. ruderalis]|uniref:Uncharacterized protein n=1 Tax=Marchantia polymorpha subsp. ruderalis TaxID=1480154 RepID=A0A176WC34_MARPO|nr:hypothetical protein AXG93_402s1100 [Marchantia polymorpha subsp. ruderalis]
MILERGASNEDLRGRFGGRRDYSSSILSKGRQQIMAQPIAFDACGWTSTAKLIEDHGHEHRAAIDPPEGAAV